MKGTPLQIHLVDGNVKTSFEGFTVKHRNAPQSYFCRVRKYKQRKKERTKAVPTFPSIFKWFLFLKKPLKMFSIWKIIFFIIQSAKNIIIIKKLEPKDLNRRHRGHSLCTLPLRRWRFDITRCSAWDHSFATATNIFNIFFRQKAGALGQKKKYVSNEIN
jgi:hypothetical protein